MAPETVTVLRVLVASPGDVREERQIARRVIDEINQAFNDYPVRLEYVGWEGVSPDFDTDPQAVINRYVGDDCEVFVGILWKRFGTPTPRAGSGTEEEFQNAYQRWREDPESVDIMLFFSDIPISPQSDLLELARVQKFRSSVSDLGGLYNAFADRDEFRRNLNIALTRRVTKEVFQESRPQASSSSTREETAPAPLAGEAVEVRDAHTPESEVVGATREDSFIITHPVSQRRVSDFYEGFLEDRDKAASAEKIFRRVGALRYSNDWKDDVAAGFNVLLHRGPFVEGSNWISYRTWEFAVSGEQHLLNRLHALVRDNASVSAGEVGLNWQDIFSEVDRLRTRLTRPSLIIVTGRLPTDLMVDLHNHAVPDWELSHELRAPWIEGTYNDIPILNIRDDDTPYELYVLDLADFATFTRYSPPATLKIQGIDRTRATDTLSKRPDVAKVPAGRPDTEPEKILQLMLRVHVLMYESYEIQLQNSAAALGAKLASPADA